MHADLTMRGSGVIGRDICLVANISQADRDQIQAVGISGVICLFVLLLPILVLEAHYIFGHRSNFLLRLFFYMTLSACILDAIYGIYTIKSDLIDFHWTCSLTDYALYVQVILVMFINLVLLSMMYRFIRGKIWYSKTSLVCAYPKVNEIIFVIGLFLCPVIVPVIELVHKNDENRESVKILIDKVFYMLLAIDWLLCIVCVLVLLLWFRMMQKNNLLRNRIGTMCKEMSLFLWFIVFVLLWGVATILEMFDSSSAWYAIFPVVQTITPVSFFGYIWLTFRNNQQRTNTRINNLTTNPESVRKSAYSDTDKNALQFLSPSTAETTELTHLLNTA